jgi:AcrR family transcriptional regulator
VPLTLRQRNRLAARERITTAALDLFDQRGYTRVTVDEIAAAAGVSPRTFYRYFGTKEGLFTTDTYATVGVDVLAEELDAGDLPGSIERMMGRIASASNGKAWRGMPYVLEEPAVRAAVYAAGDAFAQRLSTMLEPAGFTPVQARVTARTYIFGVYFGALEQWHLDGRGRPLASHLHEGLTCLGSQGAAQSPTPADRPGAALEGHG